VEQAPALAAQRAHLLRLYEDILQHYGVAVGMRHARKHLRASVDAAIATCAVNAPASMVHARNAMLTSEHPPTVIRHIADLYDAVEQRVAA
jgi:tRNA-dihydrouridine synthase